MLSRVTVLVFIFALFSLKIEEHPEDPVKISVIVAVRNNPDIDQCIESYLGSDYSNKEMVVINDCSTDQTQSVLDRYNIKKINLSTHAGPAVARNIGVQNCSGEVVFFIDSDATLLPNTLSEIAAYLKTNPDCHGLTTSRKREALVTSFFADLKAIEMDVMLRNYFTASFGSNGSAIYRQVFIENGGFSPAFKRADAEDFELSLRLFGQGLKFPIVHDIQFKNNYPLSLKTAISKFFQRAYLRSATLKAFKKKNGKKPPTTSYNSKGLMILYLSALGAATSLGLIWVHPAVGLATAAFFTTWLWTGKTILSAFYSERGLIFFLRALPTYFLLTTSIGLGGVLGQFFQPQEGNLA